MDTEHHNFRTDPELTERARVVCANLGIELNDVLRALIARIAAEGSIPFDLPHDAPPAGATAAFFDDYDERLWAPLKGQIDAALGFDLLARAIAALSEQLDSASDASAAQALRSEREAARQRLSTLDPADADAVREVMALYGPPFGRLAG